MSKYVPDSIKAIFFDHDDTLVGTREPKWAQHKHIAKTHYNKVLTDEDLREVWGTPFSKMVCMLYGTDDVDKAMEHVRANRSEFEKILYEATIPTLKQLRSAGIVVGLVTASSKESLEHDLEHHKIPHDIFDYTQTSEDTEFHKPDPRVFDPAITWLKKLSIKPEEVIYIGDGLHDMKASVEAGFNFIGVETGLVTADEFAAANVKSINGLHNLIS